MQGKFITFEGLDGSGTTTVSKAVTERLNNYVNEPVLWTSEPSRLLIGNFVRTVFESRTNVPEDAMALLFAADRAHHEAVEIKPALEAGRHVICDRHVLSSYAYQGVYNDDDWVVQIHAGHIEPDLVVFLDVDPAIAMQRLHKTAEYDRYEKLSVLESVRIKYLQIYENYEGPMHKLDATKPLTEIVEETFSLVKKTCGVWD